MWNLLKFFHNPKKDIRTVGKYILVVDDGEAERRFYEKTLKKADYEVVLASSASMALQLLEKRRPDLVISDLSMPDMDGKEMCQRIKDCEETQDIPVIFLTGSAKSSDVVDCFDVGGEYFLEKPIDARTLLRHVNNILIDLEEETFIPDRPVS